MFLLDTNVVSELRKIGDGKADERVALWAAAHDIAAFYLSAITILELELGILLLERKEAHQGERLRSWFERQVLPEFNSRILPVDAAVALRCARLHVPDPRSERDALIAATALVHGLTVVTRNRRDFEPTDVAILNPWQ
ncbi:MAG: type II toxin-antitoxin system VapC family toxin [Pseudomonadota bacterium]